MAKIPHFPNEIGGNPVVAIDLRMRDGAILRLKMPDVQQSRVMVALGQLVADLDVPQLCTESAVCTRSGQAAQKPTSCPTHD